MRTKFQGYIKAWNSHSFEDFSQYWSDDIFLHLPGCPPLHGKPAVIEFFKTGLSFFEETLHPTFLIEGDKALGMEAKVYVKILQDMTFVFPFTGKSYAAGDKFIYEFVVHYELDDNLLITTFRAYSVVLNPSAGAGVTQSGLAGFEPVPDIEKLGGIA
ncbi:hypothetical protein T440DRAFT_470428 [Plenodomus tracheiphilus IPT5]|uniref:SnoaL-like domain-containing protein n=1 Tax=Plenodomus tracheiphilus IPT5 TaxID=1408161 RepID=A0A6A7B0C3_9PLEO|nr:hypothetical protein T440DRAFT_470428 [Plenodomus tracheiphilus IPT5]